LCAWKAWFAIADAFCDFSIRETASVALGPLPPGAPPVCEMFRHYPDALERAGVKVHYVCHEHMIHHFYAMGGAIPYARTALKSVGDYIRAVLTSTNNLTVV